MTCPSIKQALDLFDDGLVKMREEQPRFAFYFEKSYRSHCCLVACCAEMIASRLQYLDVQKAYIFGLLHDYGKMICDADSKQYFHGLTGYNEMNKLGFDEVARVCLTHTFPDKDFKYTEYTYPEMRKTKKILSSIEYNDYDRLIQLCDLLVTGMSFGTIKERMAYVKDKYRLPTILIKKRYRQALRLKNYFDRRCGCDVYRLLGVN